MFQGTKSAMDNIPSRLVSQDTSKFMPNKTVMDLGFKEQDRGKSLIGEIMNAEIDYRKKSMHQLNRDWKKNKQRII